MHPLRDKVTQDAEYDEAERIVDWLNEIRLGAELLSTTNLIVLMHSLSEEVLSGP
jgi:hypothetical protein